MKKIFSLILTMALLAQIVNVFSINASAETAQVYNGALLDQKFVDENFYQSNPNLVLYQNLKAGVVVPGSSGSVVRPTGIGAANKGVMVYQYLLKAPVGKMNIIWTGRALSTVPSNPGVLEFFVSGDNVNFTSVKRIEGTTIDLITNFFNKPQTIDCSAEARGITNLYVKVELTAMSGSLDWTAIDSLKINTVARGEDYSITYNSNGGTEIKAVVTDTGFVDLPSPPVKEGKIFKGWFKDQGLTIPFTGENVYSDITVYAKWADEPVKAPFKVLPHGVLLNQIFLDRGYEENSSFISVSNGQIGNWVKNGKTITGFMPTGANQMATLVYKLSTFSAIDKLFGKFDGKLIASTGTSYIEFFISKDGVNYTSFKKIQSSNATNPIETVNLFDASAYAQNSTEVYIKVELFASDDKANAVINNITIESLRKYASDEYIPYPTDGSIFKQEWENYWPINTPEGAYTIPITPVNSVWSIVNGEPQWFTIHKTQVQQNLAYKDKNLDVMLLGDSITQAWGGSGADGAPLIKQWTDVLGEYSTLNKGIGGDKTQQVLWRLKYNGLNGINPKAIVLLIGTNNTTQIRNNVNHDAMFNGIKEVVKVLRTKLPDSQIVLLNVLPRELNDDGTAKNEFATGANALIEMYKNYDFNDSKITKLDLTSDFKTSTGGLNKTYYSTDLLHLSSSGYAFIAGKLKPILDSIIKSPQSYNVYFNSNGGSDVAKASTAVGSKSVELPAAPQRATFTFAGWYEDSALTIPFNKDNVTRNITVYAKWAPTAQTVKRTVTFTADGALVATKEINNGDRLTDIPAAPAKVGYTSKWNTDDFSNITSDRTVEAVFTVLRHTITFKSEGNPDIIRVVGHGGTFTSLPKIPAKTGFTAIWEPTTYTNIIADKTVNAIYMQEKNITTVANGVLMDEGFNSSDIKTTNNNLVSIANLVANTPLDTVSTSIRVIKPTDTKYSGAMMFEFKTTEKISKLRLEYKGRTISNNPNNYGEINFSISTDGLSFNKIGGERGNSLDMKDTFINDATKRFKEDTTFIAGADHFYLYVEIKSIADTWSCLNDLKVITESAPVVPEYTLGDVDNSKTVDINDVMLVLQHNTEKRVLTGTELLAADVNKDNKVNVVDAMTMLQKITGKIADFS